MHLLLRAESLLKGSRCSCAAQRSGRSTRVLLPPARPPDLFARNRHQLAAGPTGRGMPINGEMMCQASSGMMRRGSHASLGGQHSPGRLWRSSARTSKRPSSRALCREGAREERRRMPPAAPVGGAVRTRSRRCAAKPGGAEDCQAEGAPRVMNAGDWEAGSQRLPDVRSWGYFSPRRLSRAVSSGSGRPASTQRSRMAALIAMARVGSWTTVPSASMLVTLALCSTSRTSTG